MAFSGIGKKLFPDSGFRIWGGLARLARLAHANRARARAYSWMLAGLLRPYTASAITPRSPILPVLSCLCRFRTTWIGAQSIIILSGGRGRAVYGRAGALRGARGQVQGGSCHAACAADCGVCTAFVPRAPTMRLRMPHGCRLKPCRGREARGIVRIAL